ncbi:hypothetical protein [Nitrosopumilus sp.]|uniref:hypothetical protein n=1 Tax=Nitrosopumilus sp. TaxID=2024843 RepID=UPI002639CF2C|nr:hypothetical protein [Nitrosopumilus sp.]
MSAINNSKKSENKSTSRDIPIVGGIIAVCALLLFAYPMWYVAPEEVVQRVKVIAVTEAGCIGETYDGYAVNIGDCFVEPGEFTIAPVDQKLKERAAQMNPTN